MAAGDSLIKVSKSKPEFRSEANVLVRGIVYCSVNLRGNPKAGDGVTTARPLKDIRETAVPNGSLGTALRLDITRRARHRDKDLEIILLPEGHVSTGISRVHVRVLASIGDVQVRIIPYHLGRCLQRDRRRRAVPNGKNRGVGRIGPGGLVNFPVHDDRVDTPL